MNILFENVNMNSHSGPNSFAIKLKDFLNKSGNNVGEITTPDFSPDIQLSFISTFSRRKNVPVVLRLDGIYFNSAQSYHALNSPIERSYRSADGVIFQTDFNKNLIESWFGPHENSFIIRNGADLELADSINPMDNKNLDMFENVWSCASSWRPHKRLKDNIEYFLEHSGKNDCLVVAGENPDCAISHKKVIYAGHLDRDSLLSLYKRSKYFIHLAWLDHCPNVVVDARACGCRIICSSAGGTEEVAGKDSTVIEEEDWNYTPVKLYSPPKLNFSNSRSGKYDSDIDMKKVSDLYYNTFNNMLNCNDGENFKWG